MKNNQKLKFQVYTYINDFKKKSDINCILMLKDGRFAVGVDDLYIYNNIFFNLDFTVSFKEPYIEEIMYLKNENILIRAFRTFYIMNILNNKKIYYFIQTFKPSSALWINKTNELSNNLIVIIGIHLHIEFFSKNEKNEYYTSKVIKDAHRRDGYKTLIEIPNNKIISFSGKLHEFKIWDLITYKCIFQKEISFSPYHINIISLILEKYVLICCTDGLTIIDLNNDYYVYLVMKSMLPAAMIQLNEIEFLITNENNIMKIKFNEKTLKFEVIDSYNILKINNNCFITNFSPHIDNFDDSTFLVFQYLNN